jgi:formiminoglutamase
MNIFSSAATCRTDPALRQTRNDPDDVRLGATINWQEPDYAGAQVVILGCPQDEGIRRNNGRSGAAMAPDAIRRCLYRLNASRVAAVNIFDLGNTVIAASLEETHELQQRIVRQVLADGKRAIILGGGNDISFPDCAALASLYPDLLAINLDAHFDVRERKTCNSGTPYRQLLDGGFVKPENFFEIGNQEFSNSAVFLRYLQDLGARVYGRQEVRENGIHTILATATAKPASAIFWGFDLDVIRSADAPGVSAPNPTGLSGEEFCLAADIAGADARSRIIEFTEVNPQYDIDERTSRLTAVAIYTYLSALTRLCRLPE